MGHFPTEFTLRAAFGRHLVYDVLPIDGNDSQADEEVEVVGLVVGPASLPHPQGFRLTELPLETQQDPSAVHNQMTTFLLKT